MQTPMTAHNGTGAAQVIEYVTCSVGEQLFGLPILRVQDVFVPHRLTRVPLAPSDIAGVLNLRGRIVTAIDMRSRLGIAPRSDGLPPMAIGIQSGGELYALLVDSVGEVLKLTDDTRETGPVNLDAELARISSGVHRLEQLLVVLDVDRVLDLRSEAVAA